jgi:hypothetical protein
MVDPGTVGPLVAEALSMAAAAVLTSAVGEAVKDGYKALKEKVSHFAAGEVVALEKTPTSKGQQVVIAEIIDAQPAEERNSLRPLAEALIASMKENAPAIGMDIGRLTALEADFAHLNVSNGIGVRIGEAKVGIFKAPNMSVGKSSGK